MSAYGTLSSQRLFLTSGILKAFRPGWALFSTFPRGRFEKVLLFCQLYCSRSGKCKPRTLSKADSDREGYQDSGSVRLGIPRRYGQGYPGIPEWPSILKRIGGSKEGFKESTGQKRARIIKRLEVVEAFRESGNKPEWMIMNVVPVIRRISA